MNHVRGVVHFGGGVEFEADRAVDRWSSNGLTVLVARHVTPSESAAALADNYRRQGAVAIEKRADDCAVVVIDQARRTVLMARDAVGVIPLFYGASGGQLAFGTRMTDVLTSLGLRAIPNRRTLAAALVDHDDPVPGETFFQGVAALPPAAVLTWDDATLTIRSVSPPRVEQASAYADAVQQFGALLEQSVVRRMDPNGSTAVLVSGGLDSSAVLCLAARHGEAFGIHCAVHDRTQADESQYIEALRRAGHRIDEVPFHPMVDLRALEQAIADSEIPFLEMTPLTLQRAAERAHAAGTRHLLTGTWGDQVLSPFPPPHHRFLLPWQVPRLARRYGRYMTDVPSPAIARALRRQVLRNAAPDWVLRRRRERNRKRSIFDVLVRTTQACTARRVTSFAEAVERDVFAPAATQAIETSARWGLTHELLVQFPFLDRELVAFLLALPDDMIFDEFRLKPLLRDAMQGIVPDVVRDRRDKGDYTAVMQQPELPTTDLLEMLDNLRRPVAFELMSRDCADEALALIRSGVNIWNGRGDLAAVVALDFWLRLFCE